MWSHKFAPRQFLFSLDAHESIKPFQMTVPFPVLILYYNQHKSLPFVLTASITFKNGTTNQPPLTSVVQRGLFVIALSLCHWCNPIMILIQNILPLNIMASEFKNNLIFNLATRVYAFAPQ